MSASEHRQDAREAQARPQEQAKRGPLVPLALVVGLAALTRLWQPDLAPLRYDDVDVLYRSRDVLTIGPTATGPLTSWGIPDPPGSVYLMLPPVLVSSSPAVAVVWVGLLNVLAVACTYLLARRFLGPRVALVAGLLFAVNPWAVYFSRRSWAEVVPLFTVLALWSAYEVIVHQRKRWAALFFLALAIQVDIRILSFVYGPAALLTVALWPRRWWTAWSLVGVGLGVLVLTPYLAWLVLHRDEVLAHLAAGNRGIAVPSHANAAELVLWVAAGFGLLPATSDAAPWLNPLGTVGRAALAVAGALLVAGLAMTALAAIRRRPGWERALLPALWLVLPMLAFAAQSSTLYLHYLVTLFPALFLVMAAPIAWLLERRRAVGAVAAVGSLLFLALFQLGTTGLLYWIMQAYDVDDPPSASPALRRAAVDIPREASELLGTGERYGVEPPIRFWQAVADRTLAEASRHRIADVAVFAGETDPLTAERPALLDYLLRPALAPRFIPPHLLLFPVRRASLAIELPDVDPIESMGRFGERRAEVPTPSTNRDGRTFARISVVPERSPGDWAILVPDRPTADFERGVRFLGYRAEATARAGGDLDVSTFWMIEPGTLAPASVSLRLVGETEHALGTVPAWDEVPTTLAGQWFLGRRDSFEVPRRIAPGQYTLSLMLLDADGRPYRRLDQAGDAVQVATIQIR